MGNIKDFKLIFFLRPVSTDVEAVKDVTLGSFLFLSGWFLH